MKTITIILALLFTLSAFADERIIVKSDLTEEIYLAVENYKLCLQHNNPGVVESTLGNIIKLNYKYPEIGFTNFEKQLNALAEEASNNKIKSKALLVLNILRNPELVKEIGMQYYDEVDQFLDIMLISTYYKPLISANLVK